MSRSVVGWALALVGAAHFYVWGLPREPWGSFDPHRSWLLSRWGVAKPAQNTLSLALSAMASIGIMGAGLMVIIGTSSWRPVAIGAAGLSLVLMVLYYDAWLWIGIALDVAILALALSGWDPAGPSSKIWF